MTSAIPSLLHFYGDETCCHGGAQHLVIGGIAIRLAHLPEVVDRLEVVRRNYPRFAAEEVKWSKIGRALLPFYKDYVQVFFDAAKEGWLDFTGLCVDKHTFNHRAYNQNNPDIGFNKMVYQLLLHKVGKRYGAEYKIMVMLDHRTSPNSPDELRPMLNFDLRRMGIETFPFRRIEFRDSKKCNIIQLNDLLIGALGSSRNPHANRSIHKHELEAHIMRLAADTCHPSSIFGWGATSFRMWSFSFTGR